jgi:SPP1 family holin
MSKETLARTIALAVATINAVLVMLGLNPLPYGETEIFAAVSGVVEVGLVIWAWAKNNSWSTAAITGDRVKDAIKNGTLLAQDAIDLVGDVTTGKEGTD